MAGWGRSKELNWATDRETASRSMGEEGKPRLVSTHQLHVLGILAPVADEVEGGVCRQGDHAQRHSQLGLGANLQTQSMPVLKGPALGMRGTRTGETWDVEGGSGGKGNGIIEKKWMYMVEACYPSGAHSVPPGPGIAGHPALPLHAERGASLTVVEHALEQQAVRVGLDRKDGPKASLAMPWRRW